jgi:hypothetical protein
MCFGFKQLKFHFMFLINHPLPAESSPLNIAQEIPENIAGRLWS